MTPNRGQDFHIQIEYYRRQLDLTPAAFGELVGLSGAAVYAWEKPPANKGARTPYEVHFYKLLAKLGEKLIKDLKLSEAEVQVLMMDLEAAWKRRRGEDGAQSAPAQGRPAPAITQAEPIGAVAEALMPRPGDEQPAAAAGENEPTVSTPAPAAPSAPSNGVALAARRSGEATAPRGLAPRRGLRGQVVGALALALAAGAVVAGATVGGAAVRHTIAALALEVGYMGPGAGLQTVTVAVPANKGWVDTGVLLTPGSTLIIKASGIIRIASWDHGQTPAGNPQGCPENLLIAPGLPCYALVGRVGATGTPFEVGPSARVPVASSGHLYLGANDHHRDVTYPHMDDFLDNSGSWTAMVTIEP